MSHHYICLPEYMTLAFGHTAHLWGQMESSGLRPPKQNGNANKRETALDHPAYSAATALMRPAF